MSSPSPYKNLNTLDGFIRGWYMSDLSVCDLLLEYFENNPDKYPGATLKGVEPQVKKSTNCRLEDPSLRGMYLRQLQTIAERYIEALPYCNYYVPWSIVEPVQIQKYQTSEAFYTWHTERTTKAYPTSARHLVFMTYLNTVPEGHGGETGFFHQRIGVRPEKGLTILWPADWTHTHRGRPSSTHEKTIVTGWFNFTA